MKKIWELTEYKATLVKIVKDSMSPEKRKEFRKKFDSKDFLSSDLVKEIEDSLDPYLTWRQKDSLGRLIPRAKRHRRISDEEYLDRISNRDNTQFLYAQGFNED